MHKIELHPNQIPDDLKKYFRPKRKYGPWTIRNVIVWHKPNPMPSSAKDRFTVDYEVVFFMVKSRKYWFEPQYEPIQPETNKRAEYGYSGGKWHGKGDKCGFNAYQNFSPAQNINPLGRNKRTVWTIPTQSFPDAHFATFPEKLVEPMIKAGCPEFVCTKCGKAREKIYNKGELVPDGKGQISCSKNWLNDNNRTIGDKGWNLESNFAPNMQYEQTFKGYTDCGCNADWRPGIVWDCFCRLRHDLTGSRKVAA